VILQKNPSKTTPANPCMHAGNFCMLALSKKRSRSYTPFLAQTPHRHLRPCLNARPGPPDAVAGAARLCETSHLHITHEFIDHVSGATSDRPELSKPRCPSGNWTGLPDPPSSSSMLSESSVSWTLILFRSPSRSTPAPPWARRCSRESLPITSAPAAGRSGRRRV